MKTFNCSAEFTWMLAQHAPIAYYHHKNGDKVSVRTLNGMREVFYFADELIQGNRDGLFSTSGQTNDVYDGNFNPINKWKTWEPPPYKEYFSQESKIKEDKDIIVINNKFNPEWSNRKPYNYLSLEFLESFFEKFHDKYKIYYLRYNGTGREGDSYYDDVPSFEFHDYEVVSKFPSITTIYDVMDEHQIGFNRAQFWIYSQTKHTVTVNGGNAVLSAYFGDDVVIYGHPKCKSSPRTVWWSDSWLNKLGCNKILGTQDYDELLKICEERWL